MLLIRRAVSSSSAESIMALFLLCSSFANRQTRELQVPGLKAAAVPENRLLSANLSLKRLPIVRASSRWGSWSLPTGTVGFAKQDVGSLVNGISIHAGIDPFLTGGGYFFLNGRVSVQFSVGHKSKEG